MKSIIIAAIGLAILAAGCGNSGSSRKVEAEGVEWKLDIYKPVDISEPMYGFSGKTECSVADTAEVNAAVREMKNCGNVKSGWLPSKQDGMLRLVVYESEPLISERVQIKELYKWPDDSDHIQVSFNFYDKEKWAAITRNNIGRRLAMSVDGKLVCDPQVNMAIEEGACAVSLTPDILKGYIPDDYLEKIKQAD